MDEIGYIVHSAEGYTLKRLAQHTPNTLRHRSHMHFGGSRPTMGFQRSTMNVYDAHLSLCCFSLLLERLHLFHHLLFGQPLFVILFVVAVLFGDGKAVFGKLVHPLTEERPVVAPSAIRVLLLRRLWLLLAFPLPPTFGLLLVLI